MISDGQINLTFLGILRSNKNALEHEKGLRKKEAMFYPFFIRSNADPVQSHFLAPRTARQKMIARLRQRFSKIYTGCGSVFLGLVFLGLIKHWLKSDQGE